MQRYEYILQGLSYKTLRYRIQDAGGIKFRIHTYIAQCDYIIVILCMIHSITMSHCAALQCKLPIVR